MSNCPKRLYAPMGKIRLEQRQPGSTYVGRLDAQTWWDDYRMKDITDKSVCYRATSMNSQGLKQEAQGIGLCETE